MLHNHDVSVALRIALRVAYLGAGFAGWQRQRGLRTVQGELEKATAALCGGPVRVVCAGRTDSGVHATGQVCHLDTPVPIPPANVAAALNPLLPPDIRVMRAWRASPSFHARRAALGKRYRYRLAWGPVEPWVTQRCWVLPHPPRVEDMSEALACLPGEHDFAAFALSGHAGTGARGTTRTIFTARLVHRGRRLSVVLEGDGFLRGMARRIVGALVEVGRGAHPPAWFAELLGSPTTRPPAPTAPAHGLTLERVLYRSNRDQRVLDCTNS